MATYADSIRALRKDYEARGQEIEQLKAQVASLQSELDEVTTKSMKLAEGNADLEAKVAEALGILKEIRDTFEMYGNGCFQRTIDEIDKYLSEAKAKEV